jgi:transcriptional regulator with XRE-family HTH domain
MTQEELAHRIGYKSKSAINKIELGGRDLPQKKIADIARALGVSPAVLMGWEDEPEKVGAAAAEVLLQPEVYAMVQDFLSLDEADQAMVKAMVASLASKTKKD